MKPHQDSRLLQVVSLGVVALMLASCGPQSGGTLQQGWTEQQRKDWYEGTQGSRLMPYAWFKALEQPGSEAPFADPAYLTQFGYLPPYGERKEPLPVGFAIDRQADEGLTISSMHWYEGQKSDKVNAEPWVGLNCAACHTAEVSYQGKAVRVDGGPGMGDYQSFVEAVDQSIAQTASDPARFDRFAAKVLAGKDTPANRALLKAKVAELDAWQKQVDKLNDTPLRYGFARVDAFGHIFNKTALFNKATNQNRNPSDAPVSYPFLWNISKQVKVQWNGLVKNERLPRSTFDYGALGRNAGEVVGVFGDVNVTKPDGLAGKLKGFRTSINIDTLVAFEEQLTKLTPPAWPDSFPKIDTALAEKGDKIFDAKCASCHQPEDQWDQPVNKQKDQGIERMLPLREMGDNLTDIWMACNAATYQAKTGNLQGTPQAFIKGPLLPDRALIATQLSTTVVGSLAGLKGEIVENIFETYLGVHARPKVFTSDGLETTAASLRAKRRQFCLSALPPEQADLAKILAYKARPLDGIWATAPYLHNGSVPTLYHLLLPPAQRPTSFWIGSRDYDVKAVGFVWKDKPAGPAFEFKTAGPAGLPIDGNGNMGHVYGVDQMSDEDRWALVEYMKTL